MNPAKDSGGRAQGFLETNIREVNAALRQVIKRRVALGTPCHRTNTIY
ncbi:MAG: hypothetical protein JSU83_13800 [Deltaproteobacteria bacterium]|nr:MAG: hypothetical protein JSU83_13800 [Deltaproteobacteria bacterium]